MSTPKFDMSFTDYLAHAKQARDQDQHHDYRRQLFLVFLHDAFGIEQVDVVVEQYIQIANQQVPMKGTARIRKGWIDAVFKDLIFEFKLAYDLSRINEDLLKQLYQNLVEPETRHELGEFYTPDWLAELTLREIGYQRGQSLLDPACGSGTFLFTAIRLLIEQGLTGQALVDFALDNIMGMDVHPLAVTIAKINYILALLPHLQSGSSTRRSQRAIPIAMANALQVPSKPQRIEVIEVPVNGGRNFQIPMEAARHPNELAEVLNAMRLFALRMARTPNEARFTEFGTFALGKLSSASNVQDAENERLVWNMNVRLLTKQITEGRDSIWVYVLENTTRPFSLWHRKQVLIHKTPQCQS